jgi:hypothetical protein
LRALNADLHNMILSQTGWRRLLNLPNLLVIALLGCAGVCRLSAVEANHRVLCIHDGAKVVQVLADFLHDQGQLEVTLVDQSHLPADLSGYRAVLGYVHNRLLEPTQTAIIDYTRAGGRFVALHHMISAAKAEFPAYFAFLGIQLDNPGAARNPVSPGGGYGWFTGDENGVPVTMVNLNPGHFIVSHDIRWAETTSYRSSESLTPAKEYAALVLAKSEAYMNHKFTDGREKTVLCGMKFIDPRTHELFEQDRLVWCKSYGSGQIVYIQPGHFKEEYGNPTIRQMVLNAIIWDGK